MGQGGNAGGRPTQTARHARTCSNRFHTAKGVPQRAPPLPPTPTRPTLRRNTDRREHPGLAGRSRRRTTTTAARLITTPGPSRPKRRRTTRGQGRPAGPERRRTTEGGLTRPRRRRTTRGQGRPAGPERRRTTVGLGGDARGKPPRPALRPRPTPAPRRRLGRRVGGRPTRHSRRGPGRHDRWGVSASRSPRRKLAQSGPAPLRPDRMEDWGRRSRGLMRRSLRPFQIHAHGGGNAPLRDAPRSLGSSTEFAEELRRLHASQPAPRDSRRHRVPRTRAGAAALRQNVSVRGCDSLCVHRCHARMRHSSCGGSALSASSVRNASDRALPLP